MSRTTRLLTIPEVAAELRIGRTLVYRLMEKGDLPFIKLGRTRRVRTSDLETLVKESRVGNVDGSK